MNDASRPNFASILDESPTEVSRPKPLPEGTYLCSVGAPRYDKSSKKGTPFVEFILKPIAEQDDVDVEALEEAGGLDGKSLRGTYYTTDDAIYRLDEFHEHCGIDLSEPASRRIRNDEVMNAQVLAYVKHRQADQNDPNSAVFAEVRRTAPAE